MFGAKLTHFDPPFAARVIDQNWALAATARFPLQPLSPVHTNKVRLLLVADGNSLLKIPQKVPFVKGVMPAGSSSNHH